MFDYQGIKINYYLKDNKSSKTLVYLHGWGQNIEMMMPIAKPFMNSCNVLILDLPGFGKSEEPKEIWSLLDYAEMVHKLLKKLNLKNPILIGHSFGGKISILYASIYETTKLVLMGSPYKASQKKVSWKVKLLKKLAKIPFLKNWANKIKGKMGSLDYRNASPMMRSILVKHINTDATENCKKIKCPTIIIWGTNDTAASIDNAYEIKNLIDDSAVIVYDCKSHYAYLEDLNKTIRILESFIR